jgi:glycosyltransferase involved in cell wall biosynthesis
MRISAYIITYNEEKDIANCLQSLSWCDDIIVLDSHSTDSTIHILKKFKNVRVYTRKFDNHSNQRNWGLKNIDFKHDFVLVIDADETCTSQLKKEILSLPEEKDVTAFSLRRSIYFNGSNLKRNSLHNCRIIRLINHKKCHFYGRIHEKVKTNGHIKDLKFRLNHYQYSKGIHDWINRRNNYSELVAISSVADKITFKFFSKNPEERRMAIKSIYKKLPCQWLLFFLYNFFIKLCFLDGRKGLDMIMLETFYEYITSLKTRTKSNN